MTSSVNKGNSFMKKSNFLIGMCVLICGCSDNATTCAGIGARGLSIKVRDSASQSDLNKSALVKIVRLASPTDSLSGSPEDAVNITTSAGSYRVQVSVQGYAAQTRSIDVPTSVKPCTDVDTHEVVFDLVKNP